MQKDILLPDEKIINFRKPSILGESKFWLGAIVLALSLVTFVVFSVLYPQYNSTLSNLYGYLRLTSGVSLLNSIPIVPIALLVVGFAYLLYAEFERYFKEFTITNRRIIYQHGVLIRDANIVLPRMVSDVAVDVGIIERLLGLGKIIIRSTDAGRPDVVIGSISEPYKFQDDIIKLVSKDPATESYTPPTPLPQPSAREERSKEENGEKDDEDNGTGKTG